MFIKNARHWLVISKLEDVWSWVENNSTGNKKKKLEIEKICGYNSVTKLGQEEQS